MEYGLNSWIDYTVIGVYFVFVVTVGLVVSTGGAMCAHCLSVLVPIKISEFIIFGSIVLDIKRKKEAEGSPHFVAVNIFHHRRCLHHG